MIPWDSMYLYRFTGGHVRASKIVDKNGLSAASSQHGLNLIKICLVLRRLRTMVSDKTITIQQIFIYIVLMSKAFCNSYSINYVHNFIQALKSLKQTIRY